MIDILSSIKLHASDGNGLTRAEWAKIAQRHSQKYTANQLKEIYRIVKDLVVTRQECWRLVNRYKFDAARIKAVFGPKGKKLKHVHLAHASIRDPARFLKLSRKYRRGIMAEVVRIAIAGSTDISLLLSLLPQKLKNDRSLMKPLLAKRPQDLAYLAPQLAHFPPRLAQLAYELGITFGRRFPDDGKALATLIANRLLAPYNVPDPRPLAVVVYPRSDYNRAFRSLSKTITMMNKGYDVRFYEVGEDIKAIDAILEATKQKKGSLLFVGGHGNGPTVLLDRVRRYSAAWYSWRNLLDVYDRKKLKKICNRFVRDARIVVESCLAGKGGRRANNVARAFSRAVPHAYVLTQKGIGSFGSEYTAKGRFLGMITDTKLKLVVRHRKRKYYHEYGRGAPLPKLKLPNYTSTATLAKRIAKLKALYANKGLPAEVRNAAAYLLGYTHNHAWFGKKPNSAMMDILVAIDSGLQPASASAKKLLRRIGLPLVLSLLTSHGHSNILEAALPIMSKVEQKILSRMIPLLLKSRGMHLRVLGMILTKQTKKLRRLISSKDAESSLAAIIGLVHVKDERGFIRALKVKKPEIWDRAIKALAQMKSEKGLMAALRDKRAEMRFAAAVALRKIKSVRGLKQALKDKKVSIRMQGLLGLRSLKSLSGAILALRDRNSMIQCGALNMLGDMGTSAEAAVPAIIPFLSSKKDVVKQYAIEALGKIERVTPAAVKALAQLLKSNSSTIKLATIVALERVGLRAKAAVPALMAAFVRESGALKEGIVETLVRDFGVPMVAALPAYIHALKSKHDAVRYEALMRLQQLGARAKGAATSVIKLIDDDNTRVRGLAKSVLGSIPLSSKEIPALVGLLKKPDASRRRYVVRLLSGMDLRALKRAVKEISLNDVQVQRDVLDVWLTLHPKAFWHFAKVLDRFDVEVVREALIDAGSGYLAILLKYGNKRTKRIVREVQAILNKRKKKRKKTKVTGRRPVFKRRYDHFVPRINVSLTPRVTKNAVDARLGLGVTSSMYRKGMVKLLVGLDAAYGVGPGYHQLDISARLGVGLKPGKHIMRVEVGAGNSFKLQGDDAKAPLRSGPFFTYGLRHSFMVNRWLGIGPFLSVQHEMFKPKRAAAIMGVDMMFRFR